MSDITNPTPAAEPSAPTDYEALYRAEVQSRIAEREKYKPFAQAVGALDPQSRDVLIALAQAAADGDEDAIAEWSAQTYRNLRGADLVNAIAAQQNGQPAAPPQQQQYVQPQQQAPVEQPQYLTVEQAAEVARREAERTFGIQSLANQIASEIAAAGHSTDSPQGRTTITYAQQTGLPIADAIAWYDNEALAMMQRRQAAGAAIASSTPMTAPNGAPAAAALPTTATPRERAIARIQAANRQAGS